MFLLVFVSHSAFDLRSGHEEQNTNTMQAHYCSDVTENLEKPKKLLDFHVSCAILTARIYHTALRCRTVQAVAWGGPDAGYLVALSRRATYNFLLAPFPATRPMSKLVNAICVYAPGPTRIFAHIFGLSS